jgi:hypothetical protein
MRHREGRVIGQWSDRREHLGDGRTKKPARMLPRRLDLDVRGRFLHG